MKRHCKSRFPFLNWRRLNDAFHADTFFPSIRSAQNHTCGQICIGEKSGYWEAYPLKKELHVVTSLQDFVRTIGMPNAIKRDNSRVQAGEMEGSRKRSMHQRCHDGTPHTLGKYG